MLFLIGTGLQIEDISIRTHEILKKCEKVYLEIYTSKLNEDTSRLESLLGIKLDKIYRNDLESKDIVIDEAKTKNIAVLVIGTPLFATTHTDILIRAKKDNVAVKVIHNASILSVFGCGGLYSYSFGRTVSIPFFEEDWKPTSFYFNIEKNKMIGLHTLCLLDIRVEEDQELYMSPNIAMEQLLLCESIEKKGVFNDNSIVAVVSRFGLNDEKIKFGRMGDLIKIDFGYPLHSLIIPAKMDIIEKEHVKTLFGFDADE